MSSNSTLKIAILNSRRQRMKRMLLEKIETNKRMKKNTIGKEMIITMNDEGNKGKNEIGAFDHNPSTSSQTSPSSLDDSLEEASFKSSHDKYIDTLSRMLEKKELSLQAYIRLSNIYLNLKNKRIVPRDETVSSTTASTQKRPKVCWSRILKNLFLFFFIPSLLILVFLNLMTDVENGVVECKPEFSDIKCAFKYVYKSIYGFQKEKSHEFTQLKYDQGLNFIDLINVTSKVYGSTNETAND